MLLCIITTVTTISLYLPAYGSINSMNKTIAEDTSKKIKEPKMDPNKISWFTFPQNSIEFLLRIIRYALIKQIDIGLDIDSNKIAEIYVECTTHETANIKITARLQEYSNGTWKTIKTYSLSK